LKHIALVLVILLAVLCVRPTNSSTYTAAYSHVTQLFQQLAVTQNSTVDNSTQTQNNTETNTTQPTFTNQIAVDRTYYAPVTITLNYPSTTATSLSNVTTVSGSGFNYAGDDHSFTFIAHNIDVYSFAFTINYANATLHNILIATWEGERPMQGETWAAVASTYVVSFRLSTVPEPSYPSKEEVAQESLYQFQQLFQQLLSQDQATANQAQAMSVTAGISSTIAAVTSIIAVVFVVTAQKKLRRMLTESS
jgi:uncharacterized membrane protein